MTQWWVALDNKYGVYKCCNNMILLMSLMKALCMSYISMAQLHGSCTSPIYYYNVATLHAIWARLLFIVIFLTTLVPSHPHSYLMWNSGYYILSNWKCYNQERDQDKFALIISTQLSQRYQLVLHQSKVRLTYLLNTVRQKTSLCLCKFGKEFESSLVWTSLCTILLNKELKLNQTNSYI